MRLVASRPEVAREFAVSHAPEDGGGWLELLANGLTFDLTGLAPGAPEVLPLIAHRFGFAADPGLATAQAISLRPGAHLAAGGNLLPVVRSMAAIAAALVALPDAIGVLWHPAGIAMDPAYFARIIANWLEGGPFPALGLTALVRDVDGATRSAGLAFFTGQELRIEPDFANNPSQVGKIAVRLIHSLVEMPAIQAPCEFSIPGGDSLRAEPSANGRFIRIWRQS